MRNVYNTILQPCSTANRKRHEPSIDPKKSDIQSRNIYSLRITHITCLTYAIPPVPPMN